MQYVINNRRLLKYLKQIPELVVKEMKIYPLKKKDVISFVELDEDDNITVTINECPKIKVKFCS